MKPLTKASDFLIDGLGCGVRDVLQQPVYSKRVFLSIYQ